ncbi:kinase [Bacillus mangrovi]|uniref:Kinase n=1 Tax=Metabacillus mangrovi TaxID=1491830 RepID=A0A7X2V6J5_9BACI|nr:kinase-associated lipoprotein B [Metabacillus mangrovi]MTH55530.1 kinase [Metabacillus mangrovi]
MEFQQGDQVTGIYKTGKYAGVITAIRPMHYLVQVKAVLKHPVQGDLHSPKNAEVPLFHERRALSFNEQTNVPKNMVKEFTGDFPEYSSSLRDALLQQREELNGDSSDWAQKSLACLQVLEKDYHLR